MAEVELSCYELTKGCTTYIVKIRQRMVANHKFGYHYYP